MRSIKEANVSGKRIIIWTDLDVPVRDDKVVDDTRLQRASSTLNYLRRKGASILMLGHLARPKGRDLTLSFKPVAKKLGQILESSVELLDELETPKSKLAMLENIRFWHGEVANEEKFAREIAKLGDIYVNDCFATSHHEGATMLYLPKLFPSYSGITLEKEIKELSKIIKNPQRPLVAIIGGEKVETKLPAINNLAKISDKVLVGGRLMFEVGGQILPNNVVVASDDIDQKDIGPKSIGVFTKLIETAKTIVWNGPMGIYEDKKYLEGTKQTAKAVTEGDAYKIVGGGDTIAALEKLGLLDKMDYVSTGGGAMLVFLAGKKLPGLAALGFYKD